MPPAVAAHRYHRGCRIVGAAHPIKAFVITSGQCAQHPRQRIGVIGLCGCLWVLVGGSGGGPALRPPRLTEGRKPRPKPARDRRGRQRRAANSKNRMMDVETNDQIQPRSDRGAARLAGQVDPARRCHEGRDVQRAAVLAVLPHRRMQAPARLFGRSAGLLRTELAAIPETEKAWFRAFVTARKEGLPPDQAKARADAEFARIAELEAAAQRARDAARTPPATPPKPEPPMPRIRQL